MRIVIITSNFGTEKFFRDFDRGIPTECFYDVDDRIWSMFDQWKEIAEGSDEDLSGVIADCMTENPPKFNSEVHEVAWWKLRDWMRLVFERNGARRIFSLK